MKSILSAVIGATLALSAIEAGAQASPGERQVSLTIESSSLATALDKWAQQSGFAIFVQDWEATKNLRAPSLNGTFAAQDALAQLLSGTSFTYEWVDSKTVSIRRKVAKTVPTALQKTSLDGRQVSAPVSSFSDGFGDYGTGQRADMERDENTSAARRQNMVDPIEEVFVTGTHIQGVENKTAPLLVIDRQTIERTGYSTTQDLVRSLPQNFAGGQGGASDDGIFGVSAAAGSNFTSANGVNLRGLGNSSTLVLLNGRRMAPSAYGSIVDVSLIPLSAVDRIEILLDGSSALYGSDAVGGVVNIITREDYEGAATTLRYGSATDSSRSDRLLAQTIGAQWNTGSLVVTGQYQEQTALRALDRSFAADLTQPNDLLPNTKTYGAALTVRQDITDDLELYIDSLLSQRDIDRRYSFADAGSGIVGDSAARSRGVNVASGLRYQLTDRWSLDLGAQYSEQMSDRVRHQASDLAGDERASAEVEFRETGGDLLLSGTLFTNAAGNVGAAVGASYRRENLDRQETLFSGFAIDGEFERNVRAAYGELYVPLVGTTNAIPLVRSLALSGAVRWDDYSTFGSTSTPRFGVYWEPFAQLSVHAAYSHSFRAPDPSEVFGQGVAFIFVSPFEDTSGSFVNALVLTGSKPLLEPERARILNVGLDYRPDPVPGLTLSVDYYRVHYDDRIILPNFDINALLQPGVYGSLITSLSDDAAAEAFLQAAIAGGAEYFDDGTGVAGVRHVVDFRQQNAALVEQSGFDIQARYRREFAGGTFASSTTVSTINSIDTAFATGAASTDIANTLGNPVDLRLRWDIGWDSRRWMINGAVNYVDDYTNTAAVGRPKIDSWLTVDLVGQLKLDGFVAATAFKGATLTLTVQNLFDEEPPFVAAPALISVNYDPANANPLQRAVALEFAKAW